MLCCLRNKGEEELQKLPQSGCPLSELPIPAGRQHARFQGWPSQRMREYSGGKDRDGSSSCEQGRAPGCGERHWFKAHWIWGPRCLDGHYSVVCEPPSLHLVL
jgi:hypothetical protein